MTPKKKTAAEKRAATRWSKAKKVANAKLAASKIVSLYFDDLTPTFLVEAMIVALADAARELGLLDATEGFWPFNDEPGQEIAEDLKMVEAICLVGGNEYELKGGAQ